MCSTNPNGVGLADRLLAHSQQETRKKGSWSRIANGLSNFLVPILAPIWTPFVDCQYCAIFMERTIHAQLDQ